MARAAEWMKDVIERPDRLAKRSEAGDREMSPMAEHPNVSPRSSMTPRQVRMATAMHHMKRKHKK